MSQNTISRQTSVPTQQDNQTPSYARAITIMEGDPEQTLPPLPGREIIRTPITMPGNPPKRGIQITYSLTLTELTQYYNWLITQLQETINKIARMENDIRPHINLPQEVMKFHEEMQENFDQQVTEINRILTDIYDQLGSLLQGKAKPDNATLNLVLHKLRQHGERIQNLEEQMES